MVKTKIALVHDYIKEYGGAERVLETLHEMYPDAPVYTLVYCPEFLGPHKARFKNWDIRESFVGNIPFKEKFISIFRLIAPFVFQSFDFSEYDVILVSATGAYTPNMIKKKSAVQLCYCHTPPRYLYGYATARNLSNNLFLRGCAKIANHVLRMIDYMSSQRVDIFIANSENVKARIKKFYGKEAVVVYPPVSRPHPNPLPKGEGDHGENYYIAGGRLARPKHIDLIIKACMELDVPLKIFGKGFAGYGEELHSLVIANEVKQSRDRHVIFRQEKSARDDGNVEFMGEVTDEDKMRLLAGAKAYIFAGEDEDFGILPVEAMSVGTPVIAYRSGGVVETVMEGKTGIFFEKLTVESLKKAMQKFEKTSFAKASAVKQAEKFSKKNFEKGIRAIVENNFNQTAS